MTSVKTWHTDGSAYVLLERKTFRADIYRRSASLDLLYKVMSLFRIPLLLAIWTSLLAGSTPPAPRPLSQERKRVDNLSFHLRILELSVSAGFPLVKKILVSTVTLVEILFAFAVYSNNNFLLDILCGERAPIAHAFISKRFALGALTTLLGTGLRLWTFRELGNLFTFELSIKNEHKLVKTGPYSVVRHPSYVAVVLLTFGVTLAGSAPGSWWIESKIVSTAVGKAMATLWMALLVNTLLLLTRAPKEDEMLQKVFGKEWVEYAKRVPYWYIPGLI